MRVLALLLAIVAGALIAVRWMNSSPEATNSNRSLSRVPQYVWSPIEDETFELSAGQGRELKVPHAGKFRVVIAAEHNVRFGAGFEGDLHAAMSAGAFDPSAMVCSGADVVSTTRECELIDNMSMYLFDGRTTASASADAAAAVMTRESRASERLLSPNRVTLRLLEWKCVNFCS